MRNEYFGTIRENKNMPGTYETSFQYGEKSIPISLNPDDKTIEETIPFAVAVAKSLEKMETQIKKVATRDLLGSYNENWRKYQKMLPDGSFKDITDPELSPSEFESKLHIETINVGGCDCVEYWFEETGFFAGHGIFVQLLDGLDLSDAQAEIFG